MATTQNYNFVEILKRSLELELKEQLFTDIRNDLVNAYKEKVEKQLKPMIQAITIKGAESFQDVTNIRNELKIYVRVKIDGDEALEKEQDNE